MSRASNDLQREIENGLSEYLEMKDWFESGRGFSHVDVTEEERVHAEDYAFWELERLNREWEGELQDKWEFPEEQLIDHAEFDVGPWNEEYGGMFYPRTDVEQAKKENERWSRKS